MKSSWSDLTSRYPWSTWNPKDRTLDTLSTRHTAPPHHLKNLADTKPPQTSAEEVAATLEADNNWEALSLHARDKALAHVKVYLVVSSG